MDPAKEVFKDIFESLLKAGHKDLRVGDLGVGFIPYVFKDQGSWMLEALREFALPVRVDYVGMDQILPANYVIRQPGSWVAIYQRDPSNEKAPELRHFYKDNKEDNIREEIVIPFANQFARGNLKAEDYGLVEHLNPFEPWSQTEGQSQVQAQYQFFKTNEGLEAQGPFHFITAYNFMKYVNQSRTSALEQIASGLVEQGFFLEGTHFSETGAIVLRLYQKREGRLVEVRDYYYVGPSHQKSRNEKIFSLSQQAARDKDDRMAKYQDMSVSEVEAMAPQYRQDLARVLQKRTGKQTRVRGLFVEVNHEVEAEGIRRFFSRRLTFLLGFLSRFIQAVQKSSPRLQQKMNFDVYAQPFVFQWRDPRRLPEAHRILPMLHSKKISTWFQKFKRH